MSQNVLEGWRVLLVEDDAAVRQGLARALRWRGAEVTSAPSLARARQALGERAWDAVLLDQRLGDGNGFELIGEIRDLHPEAAIVAVSGYLDADRTVQLQEAGAALVPKPCSGDLLIRILRVQKERVLREQGRAGAEPDEGGAEAG